MARLHGTLNRGSPQWHARQEQAWEAAVHTPNLLARAVTHAVERSLEHGMEFSL
jgi:hypothetical protein